MTCVGRVMLANMYDTAASCQPAIAVFSVASDSSEVYATSPTLKRIHDISQEVCQQNNMPSDLSMCKSDYNLPDDDISPTDYSDISKRYSDDSTDTREDMRDDLRDDMRDEMDVYDDDDGRCSPDSDVTRKDDDARGEKKVYRCQHCKYITDRKNNLKRHVITMHEACSKVLECCDVVFKNKASLRDHVLQCHKNGYDCRICGRTFCRKALLKRHITVHSGQKDYVCAVCGYATSHKSNLDRHKRRHGAKFHTNSNDQLPPLDNKGASMSPPVPGGPHLPPPPPHSSPLPMPPSAPLPLPLKLFGENFWWNVLTDPVHQVAAYHPLFTPAALKPYYPYKYPKKNKQKTYKSSLLTKRLLYTYQHSTTPHPDIDQALEDSMHRSNGTFHYNAINGFHSNVKSDCKSPKKLPSSKKRLFPGLYRCHECGEIFDHQLQLHEHQDKAHTNCDVVEKVPQCPLTRLSHVMTSPT